MPEERFSARVGTFRWGLLALAASPLVAAAAFLALSAAWEPFLVGAVLSLLAGCLAPLLLLQKQRLVAFRPGEVVAGARGLSGAEVVPAEEIERAATVSSEAGATRVRVHRRGALRPDVTLELSSRDDARRLLAALGSDVARRSATFRVLAPTVANPFVALAFGGVGAIGMLAGIFASAVLGTAWIGVASYVAFVAAVVVLARPAAVEVGVDGVRHEWLGRQTLVPYADVAAAIVAKDASRVSVVLERRAGEPLRFVVGASGATLPVELASELAERIREGRDYWAERARPGLASGLLRRGDAPSAWLGRLRALADEAGDHRGAAAPDAELERVLDGPARTPEERVAAAFVLARRRGGDALPRVRVAAETTAEPRLRVALEAVADGDERALEEALAALERQA